MTSYSFRSADSETGGPVQRVATPVGIVILLMLVSLSGCNKKAPPSDSPVEQVAATPNPLKLLVIGEPELGSRLARQWSARRDGKLEIVNKERDQFASDGFEIEEEIDIVIFPPGMLGELTSLDRLLPLPKDVWNSDDINKVELLRHFRVSIARRANEAWAVPLGSPNYAMLCNSQVFESIGAEPPETWEELDRDLVKIGELLSNDQTEEFQRQDLVAKVDMPLAKGWAANTLLARAAPAVCYRGKLSTVFEKTTLKPMIASPPFVKALEHLKAMASERSLELEPKDVFELATSGRSTIALGWPALGFSNQFDTEDLDSSESTKDNLTIRPLPGMEMWFDHQNETWNKRNELDDNRVGLIGYSGLVAAVSANSRNQTTALDFIQWLPSKSISLLTLVESPYVGPFRASHLGDASRWTGDSISIEVADQYADVIAGNHERAVMMMFPRIPGQMKYLTALDDAVRQYMSSSQSAQEILNSVAEQWESTTDSIGRKKQLKELRKESGF